MSREFNIDKVFREVANQHQEAYNPQDWSEFQGQLKVNGLQAQPSLLSQVMRYLIKMVSTAAVVYIMPASTHVYQAPKTNAGQQIKVATANNLPNPTITIAPTLPNSKKQSKLPQKQVIKPLPRNINDKHAKNQQKVRLQKSTKANAQPQYIVAQPQKPRFIRQPIQQSIKNTQRKRWQSKPTTKKQNQQHTHLINVPLKKATPPLPVANRKKQALAKEPYQINQLMAIAKLKVLNTSSYTPPKFLANNIDSITLKAKQATWVAYNQNWQWSQRPRNVFQRLGRWLKLSPKPQALPIDDTIKTSIEVLARKTDPTIHIKQAAKPHKDKPISTSRIKLQSLFSGIFGKQDIDGDSINNKIKLVPAVYPIRDIQIGLVYPLSTNGTKAHQYSNKLSLNGLLGSAAALDGVEFSGFGNIEKDYVKGVQFAGFFNTVGNQVEGLQAAGFFNNAGALQGTQLAGFINLAGVTNKSSLPLPSPRFNAQAAGFGNLNLNGSLHFQGAGFFNIGRKIEGFQGAGFFNIAKEVKGFQGSGFIGLGEKIHGVQMSSFANIADQVEGLQMAGFINIAGKVKGSQIGFINIADSVTQGVPIGFLSIIKNGYRKLEIWGSESLHANIGYKIGVRKFYNIFAVGSQFLPNSFRWGLGYGIGSIRDINAKNNFNFEAMAYHISEDKVWEDHLRLLNQIKLLYGREFGNGMSLQIGPTFNVLVSQDTPENNVLASHLPPYHLFNETMNGVNVKLWAGAHIGLRF